MHLRRQEVSNRQRKKMIAAVRKELEERFQDGDFGKHAYLQSAYTKR